MPTQPNKAPDGGPAFPVDELHQETMDAYKQHFGMSLRDAFALAALQGQIASMNNELNVEAVLSKAQALGESVKQRIANAAYECADAMLAARATGASRTGLASDPSKSEGE